MSGNGGSRRIHWINGLLAAAVLVGSALVWPELPERVPGHFDLGGEVTRWDSPSVLSWFGLPLVGLALVAMLYGVARILPHRPDLFNMPDKDRFLELPPAFRGPVIAQMRGMMFGLASLMLTMFGVIQWMRYRTAQGADSEPYMAIVLVLTAITTPIILGIWLPRIQRETDRQVKRERQLRRAEADAVSDPQTDAP